MSVFKIPQAANPAPLMAPEIVKGRLIWTEPTDTRRRQAGGIAGETTNVGSELLMMRQSGKCLALRRGGKPRSKIGLKGQSALRMFLLRANEVKKGGVRRGMRTGEAENVARQRAR